MPQEEQPKKRKQKPKITVLREPDVRTFREWTPTQIRSAFITADSGKLYTAGSLCEDMLVDDRIDGVLETLSGVISFPFSFEPGSDADGRKSKKVIKALEEDWWEMFPEPTLVQTIKWGRFFGSAISHLNWSLNKRTKRYIPFVDIWSSKHLEYDTAQHTWGINTGSGLVKLEFVTGEWFLYLPNSTKRPWQLSPWKGAAPWWLLKRHARNDWDQFSLRQGQGVFSFETAVGAGASPEERAEAVDFLEKPDELAAIGLPEGMTLKMVESRANAHENFKQQILSSNTAISILLVGQNLSTEVIQGSLAAAFVHERIENRRLAQIAGTLSTAIREQVLVPWARFNFGDGDLAPWPKWNTDPPRNQEERANVAQIVSKHIKNLTDAGVPISRIDFPELEKQYLINLGVKGDTINGEDTDQPEEGNGKTVPSGDEEQDS